MPATHGCWSRPTAAASRTPNADQAAAWQLTYERLTEWLYGNLLAQTHLKPYYEAIVWNHNEVTDRAFGDLAAAQALRVSGNSVVYGNGGDDVIYGGAKNDSTWRRAA